MPHMMQHFFIFHGNLRLPSLYSLEKEMATHSSILSGIISWTEERGRLQSMRSQRVRHDLTTKQNMSNMVCMAMRNGSGAKHWPEQ